ncbi:hypothetical protein [Mastigocladopsis repens]|uniref:hypothetical protein n=1 Tax=Mastigocladopsis repens TaxID=221287 RepID=UPI0002D5DFF5|nr:hypothetical protein [Mastigocladopsis repens]
MIDNTKINSTSEQVEIPSSYPPTPQPPYSQTAYDYLALAPSLLVAVTPLIIAWWQHRDRDDDR